MEPSCLRQTVIPGTTRLFADYLYSFDKLSHFFPYSSWDIPSVVNAAGEVSYPAARRELLVAALREFNGDSAALNRLAQPQTVAIVTGQQVGFLSGPVYTIFKALTAVKLAAHLSEQGIPAVPVFWLASEDHDLAEVDHAWVFNHEGEPARISIANSVVNGGPVGDVVLNEIPLQELREALGDLPFADEVLKRVRAAYRPGVTLGSAFHALLRDILQGFGLLFIDPLAPAIREISAPFLSQAAERAPELVQALRVRDSELAKAGYHSQVHIEEDSSLLFLLGDGKRIPVRLKNGHFTSREGSYSTGELKAVATRLSPNALLRPVLQDYLLPTASYVAGPAEIAYMAQGEVLYRNLLGRMPVIYPRNGFTLLDARSLKLLKRYCLRLTDLIDCQEKVNGRIAAKLIPHHLVEEFAGLQAGLAKSLAKLQADLHAFDPTLEAAAGKSAAKVSYQLEKLSNKTARETLRRDERAAKDANYLINLIYPQRHLQERFYSILPFLAKHGFDLPRQIFDFVQLSCPDHMVRTV